jgi:hypothetical protein
MELDELASLHRTTWVWTRGRAGRQQQVRRFGAKNAAATQRSSWPDGRPHATLRLNLGLDCVPPKPQAGLFEDLEVGSADSEDDELAV